MRLGWTEIILIVIYHHHPQRRSDGYGRPGDQGAQRHHQVRASQRKSQGHCGD